MTKFLFRSRIASITAGITFAAVIVSCNPQRKVQKAIKTVTFNDTAFNHVGLLWEKFNPCVNDSFFRTDTLTEPIFIDAEFDVDSLRMIICDTAFKPKVIHVPGKCPTTKIVTNTVTIRDTRHEQIVRDSLSRERSIRMQAEAEVRSLRTREQSLQAQLKDQTKDFGRDLTRRTLIMCIPILLLLIICYLLIKKKTKIL